MKGRLKGAKTGHSLLKKKADAMQMKFRSILKKIIEVCDEPDCFRVIQVITAHPKLTPRNSLRSNRRPKH